MAFAIAPVARTTVYCAGALPPEDEFRQRQLRLLALPDNTRDFRWARSLLICVGSGGVIDRQIIADALNHGLLVLVIADDDSQQKAAIEQLKSFNLSAFVTPRTAPPWWEMAERAARWDPQQGEGDVELSGDVPSDKAFLLRRAFSDCKSLLLEKMGGGFSGAHVFRIYGVFDNSAAGPRPLPFFAKLDEASRIQDEIRKYQIYVDRYIPFYLRPHLDYSRCVLTPESGILVGDFVEHSEPLRDALISNRGRQAINSLFDEALRSWRLQAFQKSPVAKNISQTIYDFAGKTFPADRVAKAKAMGARYDANALVQRLTSAKPISCRFGNIHGDLICANVQVRGMDAILIDFYTTKEGPIVADPASLEVDIVFSYDCKDDLEAWKTIVDRLYGPTAISNVPDPAEEPTRREWLWESVRQIRMHGRTPTPMPGEYEQAVATYLLRRALYPAKDQADEDRRTYAYVFADQIIRGI